jgi:aspartyl-tRNA synthetase
MLRTHTCGELTISDVNKTTTLCGWVQKSRDLGGMTFIDLRDRYGITQLAFNMETNASLCEQARKCGREFVLQVTGKVIERSSKNNNIATGEIEIEVIEKLITQFAIRSERTNSRAEQFNQDRIYILIGRMTPSSVPMCMRRANRIYKGRK